MRLDPHHIAVTLVAALASAATVIGRLGDAPTPAANPPPGPEVFCIGLAHAGAAGGLSCAVDGASALADGVRRLRLPPSCAGVAPPATLARGDRIVLSANRNACRIVAVERLPAAERLIAGVGLDINRDPAAELELLPGIGPVRARAIVESRTRYGPFADVATLARVRGIGPGTIERLRPWLEWPATAESPP